MIAEDANMDEFIRGFVNGRYNNFGTWGENVISWLAIRGNDKDNFLLVKYEDLKSNTEIEVNRIIKFLRLNLNEDDVQKTIKLSSFETMRQLEEKQQSKTNVLKRTDLSKPFIRSGKSDEWKNCFSNNELSLIYSHFRHIMEDLGYY